MAKPKSFSLTTAANEDYKQLVRGEQLIRLCLEEDITSQEGQDTVLLLLECYRFWTSLYLDELGNKLKNLLLEAQSLEE